jgi:Zn-dependent M28 family amino/carboxypeptidase
MRFEARMKKRTPTFAALVLLSGLAAACTTSSSPAARAEPALPTPLALPTATADGALRAAAQRINEQTLLEHINVLASDEFEGRAPGTRGEELTVAYLTEQFRALGLQPGNPDGSYVQRVPLVGFRAQTEAGFRVGDRAIELRPLQDYVAVSRHLVPQISVEESELVFVGYGVVAAEYDWDDFKDVDVRGKTVIMLVNDPPVADPMDPSRLDESMFRGRAMTYYGRWTYKYEIASEKGAAAAIIVHETEPAGYPWEVVKGSWSQENFDIRSADGNAGRVPIEAWLTVDKARELFATAGQDFDALKRAAVRRDFRPLPLGGMARFAVRNTLREVQSRNVVAKLEGSHPERKHEFIVYTAHWDHLGRDSTLAGDQIYNGAVDNASGTAGLLEMANAFAALETPPDRSVLFLAVTAEERGLLGAKYYASNPLHPLERTLANINMDGLNQWGRTRDVVVVGMGNTTLEDVLEREAAVQGRVLAADPEPEKGFFYRSDHFEFAKQGVPALYTDAGIDFLGRPPGWGEQKRAEYTANDYHKPSDVVKRDWDLSGAVEDLQLLFRVGYRVAQAERWPEWKPGTEFRARREEMLHRPES